MSTLAFISLTTPAMLGGLALLALPLAAHLLNRRAKRRVVFPSIVLLAQSRASQSQLFKLRRLLLLLLRCAIVALIVLAFAQPLWVDREAAAAAGSDDAATVVVLDASASAGQLAGGVSGLEFLRAAAARALEDASARGDAMNVVVAPASGGGALFPQMTRNLAALRAAMEAVEATAARADLHAALATAGELLAAHGGVRRLVVLSDLQASDWLDLRTRLLAGSPLPERTRVTIVPLDAPPEANVALVGARTSPARPMAGSAARAVATVANLGDRDQVAHVELLLDGAAAASGEVLVEAWQQREISLPLQLPSPGDHRVTFRLRDRDALAVDNALHRVARAVESRTVVVITDADPADVGTGAYFLTRAAAPHGDTRDTSRLRVLRSGEVTADALADAAAVFIGYVAEIPPAGLAAMHGYLAGGGGVVFFGGAGPVDRNLAALDRLEPRGVLPWRVEGLRDLGADSDALAITDGDWRSPLLRAFDARSQEAFTHARFRRVWAAGEPHPEASVLLRYGDRTPAMASRPVGKGTLVVAGFSPDPDAGDLPKHGSFVALVHSLIEALEPAESDDRAALIGRPIRLAAPKAAVGGTGLHVVGPGERLIGTFDIGTSQHEIAVVVPGGEWPGFYELRLRDTTLAVAAAHVDPRESDLRRVEPAAAQATLASEGGTVTLGAAAGGGDDVPEDGRPLWGWALLAALAFVAVELGLLGYWRR